MTKKLLGGLMALMILLAGAGLGAATYNSAFNGEDTSTADQTNVTKVHVGSNGTVEVTDPTDRTISDGGSYVYETNVTVKDVSLNGSADLNATIYDGNVTVTDTNTSDASSESLSGTTFVFAYNDTGNSSGTVRDYINTTSKTNQSILMQDDDGSEVQQYEVIATDEYLANDAPSASNGHFNETTGEYVVNSSQVGQNTTFTFDGITRNNTTYEDRNVSNLSVKVGVDTRYFNNVDEGDEIRYSSGLVLQDIRDTGENNNTRTFVFSIKNESNTTQSHWVKVNATPESADANASVVYTEQVNPKGGPTGEAVAAYALNAPTGGAPLLSETLGSSGTLILLLVTIGVTGGVVYFLRSDKDMKKRLRGYSAYATWPKTMGWGLVLLVGVLFLISGMTELNVAENFVKSLGGVEGGVANIGIAVTLVGAIMATTTLILNRSNSGA